jgi:ketose-bisphosphate aldolase
MPLRPVNELFNNALTGGYALGYFESWNLESLQGVIDAAEQTRSPIIIGFNGEFLSWKNRLTEERIGWYAALGRAAAESAQVPCGFIFNECAKDDLVTQAVEAGFNLVMLADPEAPYENYEKRVAKLVQFAHPQGVAVEAEIGELPDGSTGVVNHQHGYLTDPHLAARFVAATRVDILSVSAGNIHVMVGSKQALDLDHLAAILKAVPIPLGLHGGSGIADDSLKAAIQLGVVKVNYGTYVKQRYLAAIRKASNTSEANPHKLLGMGGAQDVLVAGRLAVRDAILERIDILGCCGKA